MSLEPVDFAARVKEKHLKDGGYGEDIDLRVTALAMALETNVSDKDGNFLGDADVVLAAAKKFHDWMKTGA